MADGDSFRNAFRDHGIARRHDFLPGGQFLAGHQPVVFLSDCSGEKGGSWNDSSASRAADLFPGPAVLCDAGLFLLQAFHRIAGPAVRHGVVLVNDACPAPGAFVDEDPPAARQTCPTGPAGRVGPGGPECV